MTRASLAFLLVLACLAMASAVCFIHANFRGFTYLPPIPNTITGILFSLIVTSIVLAVPVTPVYLVASFWPDYVWQRRRRLGLCWNCAYERSTEAGPCPECGRQHEVTPPYLTYRRLVVVSMSLALAGLAGAVVGEFGVRGEDLRFLSRIRAQPMLSHNHDRVFPARGFSLHYAPDRGVWVND
ncbi:MAG: hypothetical protein ACFCBV_12235 [Phycisphaerales bacterium]